MVALRRRVAGRLRPLKATGQSNSHFLPVGKRWQYVYRPTSANDVLSLPRGYTFLLDQHAEIPVLVTRRRRRSSWQ